MWNRNDSDVERKKSFICKADIYTSVNIRTSFRFQIEVRYFELEIVQSIGQILAQKEWNIDVHEYTFNYPSTTLYNEVHYTMLAFKYQREII